MRLEAAAWRPPAGMRRLCTARSGTARSAGRACSGARSSFLSRPIRDSCCARRPRLASKVLGLSLRRLVRDWQALHSQGLLPAAALVGPAHLDGTCNRAANWIEVGATHGFGRARGARNHVRHGAPKTVFMCPLRPDAQRK